MGLLTFVRGSSLSALVEIALFVLLCALDARDLSFKLHLVGSDDAFAFSTSVTEPLATHVLEPTEPPAASGDPIEKASGWVSFLEKCESMQPFRGLSFLHTRNENCQVGGPTNETSVLVPQLITTANVRVDSMTWAACRLLYSHRKPSICHEGFVTDFLRRYKMPRTQRVTAAMMAEPFYNAEVELLGLLDVIAKSMPLSRVVCVEGFAVTNASARHQAHVFGCGSPNLFLSAFVGYYATAFVALHADKAELKIDDAAVLGMHFTVRQNAVSSYVLGKNADGAVSLTHSTELNVSCSGFLYMLLLLLDAALMYYYASSSLEVVKRLHAPTQPCETESYDVNHSVRSTFITCSLYRSQPIVLVTVIARLLAWMLVLPSAFVWTWGDSFNNAAQICLWSVRTCALLVILVHGLWDLCVFLSEKRAYVFAQRTFITSFELMAVFLFISFTFRGQLIAMRVEKHSLEVQQLMDSTSFRDRYVLSNAYNDDPAATSRGPSTLWIVYKPLVYLLLFSVLLASAVVLGRYAVTQYWLNKRATLSSQLVAPVSNCNSSAQAGRGGSTASTSYARLPLEVLLNVPIRAKQLVRDGVSVTDASTAAGMDETLRPVQFMEHGVVLDDGRYLRTRRGFFHVVPAMIHLDDHINAADEAADGPRASPSKRRRSALFPLSTVSARVDPLPQRK